MARLLLRGGRLEETLPAVGGAARAGVRRARAPSIVAAGACDGHVPAARGRRARSGRSSVDAPEPVLRRIQARIVPALESLLAAALERDALMADAVETAALRRSDVIKTALLRSVSHDLRSPLTAILTSAEALLRLDRRTSGSSWPTTITDRGDAPQPPDRQPARPLAPGGRRRRAAPRVVLDRGGPRRGRSRTSPTASSSSRSTPTCRPSAPTPPSSSARSRTCSRTRTATPADTRSRSGRATSAAGS